MNNSNIDLETERLIIRRPTIDDADGIFTHTNDPIVTKYLLFKPHKSIEETLDFIRLSFEEWEKKKRYGFVVLSKADSRIIGGIGLAFDDDKEGVARLGYFLGQKEWGKGYATEACMKMIEFAKESGVKHLISPMHPENIASIRVMEKCGFQEDSAATETLFMPNIGGTVKLVGLSRAMSMSVPPSNSIWEG